jgi:hypothetical protein
VEDEAPPRLDGTAMVHGAIRCLAGLDVQLAKEPTEADAGALVADTDADRAILVVHAQGDHRALEARVCHSRHGEKQLARQETRLVNHEATMGRGRATGKA